MSATSDSGDSSFHSVPAINWDNFTTEDAALLKAQACATSQCYPIDASLSDEELRRHTAPKSSAGNHLSARFRNDSLISTLSQAKDQFIERLFFWQEAMTEKVSETSHQMNNDNRDTNILTDMMAKWAPSIAPKQSEKPMNLSDSLNDDINERLYSSHSDRDRIDSISSILGLSPASKHDRTRRRSSLPTLNSGQKVDELRVSEIHHLLKHRYSVFNTSLAHALLDIITTKVYIAILMFLSFVAIFIMDIDRSFDPNERAETAIDITLIILISLLMIDILLSCLVYKWYPFSFFWFLEVAGTLSLLINISYVYEAPSRNKEHVLLQEQFLKSWHAIRVLALMKISRIDQYIRTTRLAQFAHIVRDLRQFSQNVADSAKKGIFHKQRVQLQSVIHERFGLLDEDDDEKDVEKKSTDHTAPGANQQAKATSFAAKISHSIFRNILIGLLIIICCIPLLSYQSPGTFTSIPQIRDMVIDIAASATLGSDLDPMIELFLKNQQDTKWMFIYYLKMNGKQYVTETYEKTLRQDEIYELKEDTFEIKADISNWVQTEHQLNIGFSLFILAIFILIVVAIVYAVDTVLVEFRNFAEQMKQRTEQFHDKHPLLSKLVQKAIIEPMVNRFVGGKTEKKRKKKQSRFGDLFEDIGKQVARGTGSLFEQDRTFRRLFSMDHADKEAVENELF